MTDFPYAVTGCLFLAVGVMLWLGWALLPLKPGASVLSHDFGAIRGVTVMATYGLSPWIAAWMLAFGVVTLRAGLGAAG